MTSAASIALALVLFAPSGSAQQPSVTLPSSTLPLRLVGVLRDTSTPARSAALIQCNERQEKPAAWLFAVGDRACDVADVREVLEDAIVIRNLLTNRLELLTLPKAGASAPPASAPNQPPVDTDRDSVPEPLVLPTSSDVVTVELRKELLNRYLSNLPEVLNAAQATPRYDTGGGGPPVIEGYKISSIKAGGIVEQMGLRDGDVLLAFNGQTLNSLAAVTRLLGQAQALDGAKMTVLRDGRRMTFVFSVK